MIVHLQYDPGLNHFLESFLFGRDLVRANWKKRERIIRTLTAGRRSLQSGLDVASDDPRAGDASTRCILHLARDCRGGFLAKTSSRHSNQYNPFIHSIHLEIVLGGLTVTAQNADEDSGKV